MTEYILTEHQKVLRAINLYSAIGVRCSKGYQKKFNIYAGVYRSGLFLKRNLFIEWCFAQTGFDAIDGNGVSFVLDKDLLSEENDICYSDSTCVFLPQEINTNLKKRFLPKNGFPNGVYFNKEYDKFTATISHESETILLGLFNTADEASQCYKDAKKIKLEFLAEKWKSKISVKAYDSLIEYDINLLFKPSFV
jgi:hypothetical protein